MTTSVRFFLSRAFPEHKDSALDMLSTSFLHVVLQVVLDLSNINIKCDEKENSQLQWES